MTTTYRDNVMKVARTALDVLLESAKNALGDFSQECQSHRIVIGVFESAIDQLPGREIGDSPDGPGIWCFVKPTNCPCPNCHSGQFAGTVSRINSNGLVPMPDGRCVHPTTFGPGAWVRLV